MWLVRNREGIEEMTKLQILTLERIKELGQEAFTIHEDLTKWKPEEEPEIEKSRKSIAFKTALEKQWELIDAMLEEDNENNI